MHEHIDNILQKLFEEHLPNAKSETIDGYDENFNIREYKFEKIDNSYFDTFLKAITDLIKFKYHQLQNNKLVEEILNNKEHQLIIKITIDKIDKNCDNFKWKIGAYISIYADNILEYIAYEYNRSPFISFNDNDQIKKFYLCSEHCIIRILVSINNNLGLSAITTQNNSSVLSPQTDITKINRIHLAEHNKRLRAEILSIELYSKKNKANIEYSIESELVRAIHDFSHLHIESINTSVLNKLSDDIRYDLFDKNLNLSARSIVSDTKFPIYIGIISILDSISSATRGRITTQVSSHWSQPLITQSLMIADSGTRKTSVIQHIKKPYLDFQTKLQKKISEENDVASKISSMQHKVLNALELKERKKFIKENTLAEIAEVPEYLEDFSNTIGSNYSKISKTISSFSTTPQLLVGNGSLPEFADIALANGGAISLIEDEGDFVNDELAQKGSGTKCLGLVQQGYDRLSFTYNVRKKNIFIPSIAFNMLIFAQPIIFERIHKAKEFGGRGGLARFNVIYPVLQDEFNKISDDEFNNGISKYSDVIRDILNYCYIRKHENNFFIISVPDEVYNILDEFSKEIDTCKNRNMSADLDRYLAKHQGRALRYATAIHIWKNIVVDSESKITIDEMQAGIEIARLLMRHAEFVFGSKGLAAIEVAKKIIEWVQGPLLAKERMYFTLGEVQSCVRTVNGGNARIALNVLQEMKLVKMVTAANFKRFFVVNPSVFNPNFYIN